MWRLAFVALILAAVPALLWALREAKPGVRMLLGVALGLRLLALPLAPTLSDDGYRYMWDGFLVAQGENPYELTPRERAELADAPPISLADLNSPDYHSVYPPTSQAFFASAVWLSGGHRAIAWWLYKLALIAVELVGLWALARTLPEAHLALYAWHPLTVLEFAGQGHTEGLALGFLALGLAAVLRQRLMLAGGWLAIAGWVKLWPFGLIVLWGQRGWRLIAVMCGLGIGVALLLATRSGGAVESLALYAGTFDFYSAPYALLKTAVWPLAGERAGHFVSGALACTLAVVISVIAYLLSRSKISVQEATVGVVVAVVLTSPTLHPWHVLPLLWAVSLLPEPRFAMPALWLVSCSSLTYLVYVTSPYMGTLAMAIGWGGALALLGAPLIPWVLQRRGQSKWKRIRTALGADARGPLLDIGAAEGYVGVAAAADGFEVVLADIEDVRRTELPFLPIFLDAIDAENGAFETSCLVFVLHHAEVPSRVLTEANRVTSSRIVVWESTPRWWMPVFLLQWLDRTANSLRPQGHHFPLAHIRPDLVWEDLFDHSGLRVLSKNRWGLVHPQTMWCLEPSASSLEETARQRREA